MTDFKEYEENDGLGLAALVKRGDVSAQEVLDAAIARVEARNPAVNAVVQKLYDHGRQQIDAGLANLPPDYRLVIDLVHRHGCTMIEAGERMGRSADAARKLYARAISALSRILNPGER